MSRRVENAPKFVSLHGVAFRTPASRAVAPARAWIGIAYFLALAVWSLTATWHSHLWLGVVAALLYCEFGLLGVRSITLLGAAELDEVAAARIAQPLLELCARAGCPVPRVAILSRSVRVAYVIGDRRGVTQLVVTRGLLDRLSDPELQAVVAHEVSHLAANDLTRLRRSLVRLLVGSFVCYFLLGYFFAGDNLPFPIFVAMGIPVAFAVLVVVAARRRPLELRADVGGVRLTGDPVSLMTALGKVTAMSEEARKRLFAGPWRWLLFPFAWKLPTHPTLQVRLDQLAGMAPLPDPSKSEGR